MKRRLEKLTVCPGVFKVLIFDEQTKSWENPPSGPLYRVFRYEKVTEDQRRRVSKYFSSLTLARAWSLGSQSKVEPFNPPKIEKDPNAGMTFGELVEIWLKAWLPNKEPGTQIRYRSYLKHFEFFWNMPVERIDASDIDEWITRIKKPEYLKKGHTTRCDYKHEFSVLRGILNFFASRYNRNYRLPFLKDHKAMLKVKEKMKVSKDLTVEEFKHFIKCLSEICSEYDCEVIYYVALMQYATYSRVQEAAALAVEDFDFLRGKIVFNKKMFWPRSRGQVTKVVDGAKTSGGKEIPMPELASKVAKEWMMKSGVRSGQLFLLDGELLTYRQIEYRYSQALHRAGLPFSATHILRHASLTEFYDTSKNLLLTAKMAGQKDLRSTTKYTKVRDDQVVQMQKQMDQKWINLME